MELEFARKWRSPNLAHQESHEVALSTAMGEAHYKIEKQSREALKGRNQLSVMNFF